MVDKLTNSLIILVIDFANDARSGVYGFAVQSLCV